MVLEVILVMVYEILESLVRGIYRFSKKIYEFKNNDLIILTKRLLFGEDPENGIPSQIFVENSGAGLPLKMFKLLSSLAESGLVEVSHYVSVQDVQRYHQ